MKKKIYVTNEDSILIAAVSKFLGSQAIYNK